MLTYEAQFTFFLPFPLPANWAGKSIDFREEKKQWPWSPTLVLFGKDVAASQVAPMTITPPKGASSTTTHGPLNFDAFLAVVFWDKKPDIESVFASENIARLQASALRLANRFLRWWRVLDRDFTIRTIPYIDKVDERGLRLIYWPNGIYILDNKTKECLRPEFCQGFGQLLRARIKPEVSRLDIDEIRTAIDNDPPLARLLQLDAVEAGENSRDREFILNAATAIEISVTEQLRRRSAPPWLFDKLSERFTEGFAAKYFDTLPRLFGVRSLKESAPALYETVDLLYNARNKVIHEGCQAIPKATIAKVWDNLEAILCWCEEDRATPGNW